MKYVLVITLVLVLCSQQYNKTDCEEKVEVEIGYRGFGRFPLSEGGRLLKQELLDSNFRIINFALEGAFKFWVNDSLYFNKKFNVDERLGFNQEVVKFKLNKGGNSFRLENEKIKLEYPFVEEYLFLKISNSSTKKLNVTYSKRPFFRG